VFNKALEALLHNRLSSGGVQTFLIGADGQKMNLWKRTEQASAAMQLSISRFTTTLYSLRIFKNGTGKALLTVTAIDSPLISSPFHGQILVLLQAYAVHQKLVQC
jgi:hypothetical protein